MPASSALPQLPPDVFAWNDTMLVGQCDMDETHQEFVQVVQSLLHCTAESAGLALTRLQVHLLDHFEIEELWMARLDFPATECHTDEHRKVLDAVTQVHDLAAVGQVNLSTVKRLAQALVDWFPGHADYMDSALSTWIGKKTLGGTPVVLRRGLAEAFQGRISE